MKTSISVLCQVLFLFLFSISMIGGCKKESDSTGSCTDGIKNQNETGIDCGGSCAACPTCSDGIKNQGETGIDCGGPCVAICPCPDGYEGVNCATPIRNKFLGTYAGSEACNVGADNYAITIGTSASAIEKVEIHNLYDQGFTATATVSGTTFDIPLQIISTGITAIGSGSLNGVNLDLHYTIHDGSTYNTCVFTGSK